MSIHISSETTADTTSVTSGEADMERAFEYVEKSIKQEFEEAREIVPELVAKETKYMDFMRVEHFDPLRAATRLAMYWKGRKVFFGERWLLPMTQTGTGALSMEDIEMVRTGSQVTFQRPGQGLFAVVDESRLSRPYGNSIFRINFYFASLFCDEATQREGTTVVHIVSSRPRPTPNIDRAMYDLMLAGMPAKVANFHVVQAYEGEGKLACLDYLGYKETKVTGFRLRKYPDRIASDSLVGTLRMLENKGLKREHLPACLGGSYDYNEYAEWMRMRISVEDIMSSTPIMPNYLSLVSANRVDAPIRRKQASSNKDENARQRNALKARRSYHRRQLELFSLREHERVWGLRNESLRRENARLEKLLAEARAIVTAHHHQQQKQQQHGVEEAALDPAEEELSNEEVEALVSGIDD